MARKGNQQKNGLDHHSSNRMKGVSNSVSAFPNTMQRGKVSETKVLSGEELPNGNEPTVPLTENFSKTDQGGDDKKSKQKFGKHLRSKKQRVNETQGLEQPVPSGSISRDSIEYMYTTEASGSREENGPSPVSNFGPQIPQSSLGRSSNGQHMGATMASIEVLNTVVVRRLITLTLSILKSSKEWLERQKPLFITVSNYVLNARDYVRMKVEHAYPIVLRWSMHFANILLLLAMVWLDCSLRGIDSLLRMGTTSFFVVIWCSTFSLVTMIGVTKILVVLAIAAFMGLMAGLTIATLLIAFSGIVFLWLYGSFWTTMLVISFGGLSFTFSHEHIALSIITVYSVYCAWMYVGWLGLLLGLNLSFISSDALIFFLRNNLNKHRRTNSAFEQAAGFSGEQWNASSPENGSGLPSDRSPGVPSTSGFDSDVTSEDEVGRLLNSTDHYSALGFSRFENVDVSILKREYRKKAILVHPDKNMGNEKAAEAFKKLQNAYEVLLDSLKRKSYDDELRREELLNYFRGFQNGSQQDRGHSFFSSRFKRTEADVEDPLGESRRMACRKCNSFHVWFPTKKSKSRARWCQDCNDFHQAKDGDGWFEQSSQPFFFGLLQKVDAPCAYVCADSKIYDATEWYICQGMRCPVNTHKPSFHVNTSVTSKHTSGKGNSGQRGGGIPSSNMEETMTEEEFEEWLLNAMQAGMFDNFAGGNSDSPSTHAGTSFKSGGGNPGGGGASSSGGKRKKKGKKQW